MILDAEIPYQKYTGRFNKSLITPPRNTYQTSQEHLLNHPGTLIKPPGNTY